MRLELVQNHSFTESGLEILAPFLDRDDVKLEDVPFVEVCLAIERYIKETDTLVIDSVYGY
jgi:hypothetical protein